MNDFNEKDISMTFLKGMKVLECFSGIDRAMSISEIAKKTDLNRTVTRRLVLTLEHLKYLESTDRRYSLTPRILRVAGGFLQGHDIGKHVTPILKSFSDKIKESISFVMLDEDRAIYVAHSPGDQRLITQGFTIGSTLPLHATGLGRAILAFCPEDRQKELLKKSPCASYTNNTTVDPEKLKSDLTLTRARNYALVINEFEEGVTSLAVPVLHQDGELIGAVGIVGPNPRFQDEKKRQERLNVLHECAEEIAMLV